MNQTIKESSFQQEFTFTVGNITGEGVTLVDRQYNVIQLPKSLLPIGSVSGSIIRMTLKRDLETQRKEQQQINALIQKLETGQQVGDTIIGIDEQDLEISPRPVNKQKNDKKVEKKPQVKPPVKAAQQVKMEQKPATGMKKKAKIQQAPQQKVSVTTQVIQPLPSAQKPIQRQKSASRRTSSAMKKIKPQSTQTS